MTELKRPSLRGADQLRDISISRNYTKHAEGSVLVEFGDTKVLCNASVETSVPRFLKGSGKGWITAEYGMLPRSTNTRMDREAARGKQSGRSLEIQRLIGRSLRAAIDSNSAGRAHDQGRLRRDSSRWRNSNRFYHRWLCCDDGCDQSHDRQ